MTQNVHNAVIHLGHQNGTVTLWTPNLSHPAVRLLAHVGPVVGVSMDPSTGGRYMATSGQDGTVKVWDCRNWKGAIRQWSTRGGGAELEWSQKGVLAVATGGSVNVSYYLTGKVSGAYDIPDIRKTGNSDCLWRNRTPQIVPNTPYSPPTPHIRPILPFPGYPHGRTLLWIIQHPRPWCRRTKL